MLEEHPTTSAHRLLGPRTTYLIGSTRADGSPHVCAASNVTSVGTDPQAIALALTRDSETSRNISRSKDFTVNLLASDHLDAIWIAGHRYSGVDLDDTSVFAAAGLTPAPSLSVEASSVAEASAVLECSTLTTVDLQGDHLIFIATIKSALASPSAFSADGALRFDGLVPPMQVTGPQFGVPVPFRVASTTECQALVRERAAASAELERRRP